MCLCLLKPIQPLDPDAHASKEWFNHALPTEFFKMFQRLFHGLGDFGFGNSDPSRA